MAETGNPSVNFSIVVPVYNSAPMLEELFARISQTMDRMEMSYEVIFVSDGSRDQSWAVLSDLYRRFPDKIIAIELTRNYGQHPATLCGLAHGNGKYFITIDDDLQSPPEEIPKLWARHLETEAAVVYGVYPVKKHSIFRNLGSKILKKVFAYQSGGIREGSSFRLIRGDIARAASGHNHHFVFVDQLLAWHTMDVAAVDVDHKKRSVGRSGYSSWKLFRLAIKILLHYTDLPLRIMKYTGMLAALVSFGIGIYYLFQKISYGDQVELGFAALIVTISFASGIILLSLGVIGEYIGRLYDDRAGKPTFAIRNKLDEAESIRDRIKEPGIH